MAFATYTGVVADDFRWVRGAEHVRRYESSPGAFRPFCPTCGSVVPFQGDGPVFMPAGNLDGDVDARVDSHIFVGWKAPWYDITDDAPQYDAYPPGYGRTATEVTERVPATDGAIGGSCLCGAVRYEFDESLERMGYCHCSRCRKSRSAAHSSQLFAEIGKFRWLDGEDNVTEFKLPEAEFFHTSFCKSCGSIMPTVAEPVGMVMIPAGSLDQDPGVRPTAHIYVESKANWVDITDELLQFPEMPPT